MVSLSCACLSCAGSFGQGMDTSNVDTLLVGGAIRKRGGSLVDVDLARLAGTVAASRRHVPASL